MIFPSGTTSTLIVNVVCDQSSFKMPDALMCVGSHTQYTTLSLSETTSLTNGRVLLNFVDSAGKTIPFSLTYATVLAPGATVFLPQNINGTVIAGNVTISGGESHRDGFIGKLRAPAAA